ncbi:MAG: hypothetical protein Q9177_000112 [Variospora cf. flavescens]
MAVPQPVIVCQEKVRAEQVLIEKAIDTMTEMLQELEQHRAEKPSGRSVAGETLEDDNHDPGEGHGEFVEHIEPVRLQERLVLRSNVPISKEAIRALHEKYREAEAYINKVLVEHTETGKKLKKLNGKEAEGFSEEDYILLRGALRETHQAWVARTLIRNAVDSLECQRTQSPSSNRRRCHSGDQRSGTARAILQETRRTK